MTAAADNRVEQAFAGVFAAAPGHRSGPCAAVLDAFVSAVPLVAGRHRVIVERGDAVLFSSDEPVAYIETAGGGCAWLATDLDVRDLDLHDALVDGCRLRNIDLGHMSDSSLHTLAAALI